MSTKKSISRIFSVLFVLAFMLALTFSALDVTPSHAAGILYAAPGGTGDCSSWANACTLQNALTGAVSGDEIWAAAGTYKPTTDPANRDATFQLIDGVAVYGGFAGTETARSQRNPAANVTILSGDIDNNDSQTPIITDLSTVTGNTTNSYHVVTGATGATLDGFTITAGNANTYLYSNWSGGGMYNESSSPTLTDVTFSGNSAFDGGGMYNESSSPTMTDVTFSGNLANYGGGIANRYSSSPTLTNVTFSSNSAGVGGGMYNTYSSPTLTDVTFSGNESSSGGGMYNDSSSPTLTDVTFSGNESSSGGGMYNSYSSPTLTNVTFSSNSASDGGGMYNDSSSPTLTNVTFNDNSSYSGGGMYNQNSSPHIRNTIFWGNTKTSWVDGAQIYNDNGSSPVVSDSVVQAGCPSGSACTNIIITDPKLGPLGNYGGLTQTIPLLPGSSAIDAGNDTPCPATDQRGVARPQGAHCDIGAYEYDHTIIYYIYYVKLTASGTGDCSSWANACTLQNALTTAISGNEIWVAAGTYKPTTVGTDRGATFQLKNGVALYGGFAGTETARDQRNPATHLTFLSGEIGAAGNSDNSYHVVTGADGATGPTLDCFTITAGNANGTSPNDSGGGMYNYSSSSPTLTNVTFSGNSANYGGGMYNGYHSSSPTLTNVTFSGNSATTSGGGMYNLYNNSTLTNVTFSDNSASGNSVYDGGGGMYNDSYTSPALTNVTFSGNSAQDGGGMFNWISSNPTLTDVTFSGNSATNMGGGMNNVVSSPTLTDVTFSGNSATNMGGGMYNDSSDPTLTNVTFSGNMASGNSVYNGGGGMYNDSYSSPTLTNVTFNDNLATRYGGGMYNYDYSNPTLTNVTFSDNSASYGGGMYNWKSSNATIRNTIIWGNTGAQIGNYSSTPIVSDSVVQAGCPAGSTCTNIIETDPLLGTLGNYGGFTQTIPLLANSSAINTGNDAVCPATDQRGITRPQGAHCDIGAFELVDATAPETKIIDKPANLDNDSTPTFTFSGDDGAGSGVASFMCRMDGGTYADCTSPFTSPTLAAGSHTFYVYAIDILGNADASPASHTWTLDTIAPTVVSSVLADPQNTNAASVDFTVTFSEAVTGVDVTDFSLTTTGVSGASVTSVSGSGSVYTVTANTGSGNGTLRLDVPISVTITDLAGNPLADLPYTGGETYTITKVFTIFLPFILR